MGRACSICSHPRRDRIDEALVVRQPYRELTALYGLSKSALSRHVREHIVPYLAKARAEIETDRASKLVHRLIDITTETREILREVREGDDPDLALALKAIARLERQLELEAKIEQVISDAPNNMQINVLMSPEWAQVRTVLMDRLAAYPEAASSVSQGLLELEGA